jgi:hypothetical protein
LLPALLLQAALAAASKGGGVVYLPPGTYRCSEPLHIKSSNVVLRGAGVRAGDAASSSAAVLPLLRLCFRR